MNRTVQNPVELTLEEIEQLHEAILYASQRLSDPEWAREPAVQFALRREFSHALSEILQGQHLPFEWSHL